MYKCLEAKEQLDAAGVKAKVVSMPSVELFEAQSAEYKERVLPHHVTARVAVEAGATQGWYKYVGLEGAVIGLDRFGGVRRGRRGDGKVRLYRREHRQDGAALAEVRGFETKDL